MNKYEFAIYNLLEKSLEFQILESKMKKFNPLKIVTVEQSESIHSNIIAFLLDPNCDHKLGDFFIKKILDKAISKQENQSTLKKYNIDIRYIKESSFKDLEVIQNIFTNKRNKIDILAVTNIKHHVILIENRYRLTEAKENLNDKLIYINKYYSGYITVPIVISVYDANIEAEQDKYLFLNYGDIMNILTEFIEEFGNYINRSIADFINYYIDILERELVNNQEDIKLASEIYKMHKDSVDLLMLSNAEARNLIEKNICKGLYDYHVTINENKSQIHNKLYLRHKETLDLIWKVGNDFAKIDFWELQGRDEVHY